MRAPRILRSGVVVAALAVTSIVVTTTGGVASTAPPEREGPRGTANWSPCFQREQAELATFYPPELGLPTFECTTVQVPLDHDEPRGGTISISMVRLPALDPANRIGSLFLNPGGPGGSGVEFAVFGAPFLYSLELRKKFDVIGFDPRGIGRSTALKCFGNVNQAEQFFAEYPVVAFPRDAAEAESVAAHEQQLSDRCDQRGNKVLGHMSTANVARDLDLLRHAVGDEQLTYAGYSYGSYLGVTYANLFPERVRALIVDGVLNPVDWSTGDPGEENVPFSSRLRSNIGAQDTLEEFFRLCDAAGPPACALAPDAGDRFQALAEALLDDEPVVVTVPAGPDGELVDFPVFYGDLIGMTLGGMYDSSVWPFVARDLALLEATIAGNPPFEVSDSRFGETFAAYTAKRGFPRYFNFAEGFPAVACADSDNPDSISAWVAAAGGIDFDDYFRQLWTYASSPCLSFPADDDDRFVGPFDTPTANPVLVASTLYDPATPVHGAYEVDALLPNSGLLLVDGWGHTTLGISGCASFFSEQYLITQDLPPNELVCPQDFDPFLGFGGPPGGGGGTEARLTELRLEARSRFLTGG